MGPLRLTRSASVVRRTSRTRALALILASGMLMGGLTTFGATPEFAGAATSWSTPQSIDAQSPYGLSWVSCVSASFCVAVDSNGYVLTYDGNAWSTPHNIDSSHHLFSVSCVSNSFCVAVDGVGNVLTFNGSAWSAPQSIVSGDTLSSVSCDSTVYCMAVSWGGLAFTMTGSVWSPPGLIDSSGTLFGVSCPPSSGAESCAIVGGSGGSNSGQAFVYNGNTFSGVGVISNDGLFGVSCPSEIFCVAVDDNSDVLLRNGVTWSSPNIIDAGNGMTSVSCPSTTFCVAVDNNGNALTYNGTSWSSPNVVDAGGYDLTSVSCPSSNFCAAVDNYGRAMFYRPLAPPTTTTTTTLPPSATTTTLPPSTTSTTLPKKSVPGAPQIHVSSSAKGSISISVKATIKNGGSPISKYQFSLNGKSWVNVSKNSHGVFVISHLISHKTYSVRLRAVNSVGAGASSNAVKVKVK